MSGYHPGAVQFGGLKSEWAICLRCRSMRHKCSCKNPLGSTDARTTWVDGQQMTRDEALEHERNGARE